MRRLIWGFAGPTYQIVGNIMSRLTYIIDDIFNLDYYLYTQANSQVIKTLFELWMSKLRGV